MPDSRGTDAHSVREILAEKGGQDAVAEHGRIADRVDPLRVTDDCHSLEGREGGRGEEGGEGGGDDTGEGGREGGGKRAGERGGREGVKRQHIRVCV